MKESITSREQELAERFPVTSVDFKTVSKVIDFPSSFAGLTILDIGAGLSPIVYDLQRLAANALALDYVYGKPKELQGNFESTQNFFRTRISSLKREIRQLRAKEFPDTPDGFTDAFVNEVIDVTEKEDQIEETRENLKRNRQNANRFIRLKQKGKVDLVAALAGRLPFADNSVDFCFSVRTVSYFLGDRVVARNAIKEALRVLKLGGEFQIYPWVSDNWTEEEKAEAKRILNYLKRKKVPYSIRQNLVESKNGTHETYPTLRLVKP